MQLKHPGVFEKPDANTADAYGLAASGMQLKHPGVFEELVAGGATAMHNKRAAAVAQSQQRARMPAPATWPRNSLSQHVHINKC